MKVSTVDKEKAATETGKDGSSLSDSTTALLCCILFIFSTTCLTFVVYMFWRLRALYKVSNCSFVLLRLPVVEAMMTVMMMALMAEMTM